MSKRYKYRIVKKRDLRGFRIEKKKLGFLSFLYNWKWVDGQDTVERCDKKILEDIELMSQPEIQIIKEVNPYA